MSKFKEEYEFEKRLTESTKIRNRYPDRIPVIVEVDNTSWAKELPTLEKIKYLVPQDMIMSQFLFVIRRKLKLPEHVAVYVFIDRTGTIPVASEKMINIYEKHKSPDNYIYFSLRGESFFGH